MFTYNNLSILNSLNMQTAEFFDADTSLYVPLNLKEIISSDISLDNILHVDNCNDYQRW